jgi:hypothetical protein
MTIQTRQAVFETNSSSTHSLSISSSSTDLLDTLPLNEQGEVVLNGGQFGWEVEDYSDAGTKASYAAIYVSDWSGKKSAEFKEVLDTVIKQQTGCSNVVYNFSTDWSSDARETSYIDHQSVEGGQLDYLFEDPELLRQFIFNPRSVLHTDNDNY